MADIMSRVTSISPLAGIRRNLGDNAYFGTGIA
jgi:hypothetical protein